MKGPTLAAVREVLLQLGFHDHSVADKYHRFEYPLPDTVVLLPPYKSDDQVSPGNLLGIRVLLDYRGLMSPAAFEEALQKRVPAGEPS